MADPRVPTLSNVVPPPVRRRTGALAFIVVMLTSLAVAGAWCYVAYRQLGSSITRDTFAHVDHARAVFDVVRARTRDGLRSQCSILAEDPRLKTTLSTEGMDEATMADILADLSRLRQAGLLVVLSADGRVLAQAGAEELRGLDLSASGVVKSAQGGSAVMGSWVIGGKIMDLSIMTIRFDTAIVAYLVVGRVVDEELLKLVGDATGTELAIVVGSQVTVSSTPRLAPMFAAIARGPATHVDHVVADDGQAYTASVVELNESAQAHPRLAIARSAQPTAALFEPLRLLLFALPLLVLGVVAMTWWSKRTS